MTKSIALDAGECVAGFRLFRPQHSREQRCGLHHVPRTGCGDAAEWRAGTLYIAMVPGMPSRAGEVRACPKSRGVQSVLRTTEVISSNLGRRLVKEYKIQSLQKLFDVATGDCKTMNNDSNSNHPTNETIDLAVRTGEASKGRRQTILAKPRRDSPRRRDYRYKLETEFLKIRRRMPKESTGAGF